MIGAAGWGDFLPRKVRLAGARGDHRSIVAERRRGLSARAQHREDSPLVGARNAFKMNLNEYLVTIHKPLGIRFAQTLSGKVFVDALAKQGNAENSRLIMVGDVLKRVLFGDAVWNVDDFGRVLNNMKTRSGEVTLILERSVFPSHIQALILESKLENTFNYGAVGSATWNNGGFTSPNQPEIADEYGGGNVGFVTYAWRFLLPKGIRQLASFFTGVDDGDDDDDENERYSTDEDLEGQVEWSHGNFQLQEFTSAQLRASKDLTYSQRFGLRYTKMTEHVVVGSCLQNGAEMQQLKQMGITAILNLQSESEQLNWGIDKSSITEAAQANGMLSVFLRFRDVDTVDLRRKLPLAVGILYRLLRAGHHIYVTCTSGMDRAPACVIAYLHWIQDVPLQSAVDFVTNLHLCGPDRPALVWATWDLIAMVEKRNHDGPPTHAVQFVWNHGCKEGEEVLIVGDFKGGGWNEPIKATHASGPKYIVDLRVPQGKYQYKFIVGGQWRHSNSLPTEMDRWGNVNNVLFVGGRASTTPEGVIHSPMPQDLTTVKVIERLLTEEERFTLAFAARRLAFSVCPSKFAPKSKGNL
ncbi:hypothetical protein SELMODRAFT_89622 [Selaginella moellendorffii]|uniref:AMP-activated protein kinase glycogen-binding domain-containing protein n=1 Tax=Selaginella moellendorffii TaxID=88036 RepID=D8RBG4_SELML|nr:hypothetical protein SELMODRAFT_89622 [Selaginella moellendorffii]